MSVLADAAMARVIHVGEHALMLRDVSPADMDAVVSLHTRVFGPDVDAHWFAWKYGQAHRQGRGQAVGAWHGDSLIAFCGGIPRTLWRLGEPLAGLQIGDVMVHPAWRGILTRRGPFFQVSDAFYNSRLGTVADRSFQLGYGFPNFRHLRLAGLMGLLHNAGHIETLGWAAHGAEAAGPVPSGWRWKPLQVNDAHFDKLVNSAWLSMLNSSEGLTLGQRDAAYFRWRYIERPAGADVEPHKHPPRYSFFTLQQSNPMEPAGVAVLDLRTSPALWLDWVGPVSLMPLASRACAWEAGRAGANEMITWASAAVADRLALTDLARREVCAGLGVPVRSVSVAADSPQPAWWLMSGDTDFL